MDDFEQIPSLQIKHNIGEAEVHNHSRVSQGRTVSGTKRTFSDRATSLPKDNIPEQRQDGMLVSSSLADDDSPLGKRQRGSEWPLPSSVHVENIIPLKRETNASRPLTFYGTPSKSHTSRFVEGSMNNRRSIQPPSEYTNHEDCIENYDGLWHGKFTEKPTNPRHFEHERDNSVAPSNLTGRSDMSKHSRIFKFGQSLAASFNPSNWKLRLKISTGTDESARKAVLQQQKHEAEKKYQDFKKNGVFQALEIPPRKLSDPPEHNQGVQVTSGEQGLFEPSDKIIQQYKRHGCIFSPPVEYMKAIRDDDYVSDDTPSIRSCFNLKKPTTPLLHKHTSGYSSSDQDLIRPKSVCQLPSRKDLQKQQKLVKKVSDLETKLELARRELSDVLGEPLPSQLPRAGRNPFVRGVLSSLPSERLLSGFKDVDIENSSTNGKALSTSHKSVDYARTQDKSREKALPPWPLFSEEERATSSACAKVDALRTSLDENLLPPTTLASQVLHSIELKESQCEPKDTTAKTDDCEKHASTVNSKTEAISPYVQIRRQVSKKRKSSDGQIDRSGRYRPPSESDDEEEWKEAAKLSMPKKHRGGSSKIQKTSTDDVTTTEAKRPLKSALKTPRTPDRRVRTSATSGKVQNASNTQTSPPPPSSEFVGVKLSGMDHLSTPRPNFPNTASTTAIMGPIESFKSNMEDWSRDVDIPPVPKIPEELMTQTNLKGRVGSVMKQNADNKSSRFKEVEKGQQHRASNKTNPQTPAESTPTGQEFEWDEEVF